MKKKSFLLVIFSLCVVLTACSPDPLATPLSNFASGTYATGVTQNTTEAGTWASGFILTVDAEHPTYDLLMRGSVLKGNVYLQVESNSGESVWKSQPVTGAIDVHHNLADLPPGDYTPSIVWEEPITATLELFTLPNDLITVPVVKPMALVGGSGMVLVAVLFLIYGLVKRMGWKAISFGAFYWIFTVAVKFLIAIPLNPILYKLLVKPDSPGLGDWIFNIYVGLLTGITEILIVWLFLRRANRPSRLKFQVKRNTFRLGELTWQTALGFGIGFGAIEALLLGLSSLVSVSAALSHPAEIPLPSLTAIAAANNLLVALAPISERLFTVLIHIFCNVLLFYAVEARQGRFFWYAFLFKSALDTVAAYAQLTGITSLAMMYAIEAIVALFGLASIWGIRKIHAIYPAPKRGELSSEPTPPDSPE
jgi:uncharacterized membrane protein YhfC